MAHLSKRRQALANTVDRAKMYPAIDAMKLIKDTATAKFDESVDVAVNLGSLLALEMPIIEPSKDSTWSLLLRTTDPVSNCATCS